MLTKIIAAAFSLACVRAASSDEVPAPTNAIQFTTTYWPRTWTVTRIYPYTEGGTIAYLVLLPSPTEVGSESGSKLIEPASITDGESADVSASITESANASASVTSSGTDVASASITGSRSDIVSASEFISTKASNIVTETNTSTEYITVTECSDFQCTVITKPHTVAAQTTTRATGSTAATLTKSSTATV